MQKKINICKNNHFFIENAFENLNYDDEVVLSAIIDEKKYIIRQDSYKYSIGYFLKLFSDSVNYFNTDSADLGCDYFAFQDDLNKNINSHDLHEFDYWVAFASDIAVLFYKKGNKMYCQVTQNDWEKGEYKSLCIAEITEETLAEWKKVL